VAIEYSSPYVANDLERLDDILDLLEQTGHPVAKTTLRNWIRKNGLYTERNSKGEVLVSFTDVLLIHRDMVRKREGF
jgi:hypothetical protein